MTTSLHTIDTSKIHSTNTRQIMNFRPASYFPASLVFCATLLLSACGGGSLESMLASSKEYLAKNDPKAAVIQIKNALQKNPESPEARFLLGKAMIATGDFANAELELRKALDLKHPADEVVPQLANAMLAQGQYKKLTDQFSSMTLTNTAAKAELQTALASAHSALGKPELAQRALSAALEADPSFGPALIAMARQKAVSKDFDGALRSLDEIIAKNATSYEAWRLKGDVLSYGKNLPKEALEAYRKVIELKPDHVSGHSSILAILLAQRDLDGATAQMALMKKVAPNNPQTKFIETQLAFQKRDFKTARELAQQLLRVAPNNPKALQLAGAIEFQFKSYVQAETFLNKAVMLAPEFVLARRLLIMTYLRSGQSAKALATLNQGIAKSVQDPEIDSVAGEVYLQNGDMKKAEEYFARAVKLAPKDPKKQTSLALTHLLAGKDELAFGELQEVAASDPGITADMALISAHLRRGNFDKALKAIDGLEKKQPDKPFAHNLRGRTLLAKKDIPGARKSFEQALVLNPTYFPAVASLAGLDLVDKKPEDAKKRFNDVIAKEPKNVQALLALAELSDRTGAAKDDVAALIAKAVDANPTEVSARLLLVEFHLANKQLPKALTAAQSGVSALPESPELLDALGRAQLLSGETNQAIVTLNKVVGMQPLLAKPLLRLADAQLAAKNKDGAVQSLKKALDLNPDLLDAQRGLIQFSLQDKKYSEAQNLSRTVQKQRPKEAIGYLMEGEVQLVQQKWDAAATIYRAGLKEVPNSAEIALKLHSALVASSKTSEADKFSATWLKDFPKDPVFQHYLGDVAIAKKDYASAEKFYSGVVKLQPTNPVAMNNLAWVTGRLNKPGAVEIAESAVKIAPNQAAFIDTLAGLLADKNDFEKALEWQNKAIAIQPQNNIYKVNLAKIYIKGGKKDLARSQLEALAKLGDKFQGQSEVASLLKSL
jgi:cellulose synthase operon protein C